MNYGANGKPHALTSITDIPGGLPTDNLSITYTDFKKVNSLTEGIKKDTLSYGVDEQRIKSVYKVNNVIQKTRYYMGNYEEEITNGNTRKIHYLSGGNGLAAIYVQNNGNDTLYYVHTDYQGSLTAVSLSDGTVKERYAFDPWGNRRNPNNWTQSDTRTAFLFNRGYTMHEHLPEFKIINMNGRVYDPVTAMFFSPDPFVQAPGDWLNYNRYTYCLNNPFKYTDPSGEWFGIDDLLIAAAGFVFGYVGHGLLTGNWGWKAVAAGGMGAGMAWLGYNTAGMATGVITNSTWNQVGSMAINAVANQIMPPMYIPLGDHFGIGISPAFGLGVNGLTGGLNMTGTYTNGDFSLSAGIGAGDNYWGWNVSAKDDGVGLGYGLTYYGNAIGQDGQSNTPYWIQFSGCSRFVKTLLRCR